MNVAGSLVVIISINMMLFLGQVAMGEIYPETSSVLLNYNNSPLSNYDTGSYTLNTNMSDVLPNTQSSVSPTTGNIFTDSISTFKSWLLSVTGLKYMIVWFNALPNFLKAIHLPPAFAFAIGAVWHIYGIIALILLLLGRGS